MASLVVKPMTASPVAWLWHRCSACIAKLGKQCERSIGRLSSSVRPIRRQAFRDPLLDIWWEWRRDRCRVVEDVVVPAPVIRDIERLLQIESDIRVPLSQRDRDRREPVLEVPRVSGHVGAVAVPDHEGRVIPLGE